MTRAVPLKVFVVVAVSFAIASIPESSFAQRGGGGFHGGGGGFHGGGFGGGGFRGGYGGWGGHGSWGGHGGWGGRGGWDWDGGWAWPFFGGVGLGLYGYYGDPWLWGDPYYYYDGYPAYPYDPGPPPAYGYAPGPYNGGTAVAPPPACGRWIWGQDHQYHWMTEGCS